MTTTGRTRRRSDTDPEAVRRLINALVVGVTGDARPCLFLLQELHSSSEKDEAGLRAGGAPKGAIADAIKKDFGSFEHFQSLFTDAATKHFGSGWAFLVVNPSQHRLEIVSLPNQDSVMAHGGTPGLLCCDVWEHAYYLKYRNRRPDYLSAWWNVIAWDVVDERLRDVVAGN